MDLRSNNPYWLLRHGIKTAYPSLQKDAYADVTVIGGGITGAIVTHYLCNAGFSVSVVDKRHVGFGSTAACTGLLQYEIDTPCIS
jgi:ribulose 1,5-bisphosphate synthetase/thiazole synthase